MLVVCCTVTAIENLALDRNGILCDNILQLLPYVYTIMTAISLSPDPEEATDSNDIPWWAWLFGGIGLALVVGALTILSLGAFGIAAGGMAGAILHGAAVGTLIGAGIGTAVGAGIGAIYSGATGSDLFTSMATGALMGFGIGAIAGAVIGGTIGGINYIRSTTCLYRAVSAEEFASIKQAGKFDLKTGAFEGKQFGLKLQEVRNYANLDFNKGVYNHIVKIRIPKSVSSQFTHTMTDAFVFKSGIITVTSNQMSLLNQALVYLKFFVL